MARGMSQACEVSNSRSKLDAGGLCAFSSFWALCLASPGAEAPAEHGRVWGASGPGWEQGGSV